MRVAVSSMGQDLDSSIDPNFGRCRFFLIIDDGSMDLKVMDNPAREMASGAGIKAAEAIARAGVGKVITGSVGPNAMPILEEAGIEVITGHSGAVRGSFPSAPSSEEAGKGSCVCPKCGKAMRNSPGVPCFKHRCPDCGTLMERKW